MKIDIKAGIEAAALANEPRFRNQWGKLYESCRWASVFQSENFVLTWYATYQSQFNPVIVTGRDAGGTLVGFLPLAMSLETKELVVAGSWLAEYHTWLARSQDGDTFIIQALHQLSDEFPNQTIRFMFVPPATPLEWAERKSQWSARCIVRKMRRPLRTIGDGRSFRETLAKKRYKSRIHRLERLGNLRFERIIDVPVLATIYDEIASYAALRLGASHDVAGAHLLDPLKKSFYLNMMQIPNLLHATVLRLDDQLISAQINMHNRDQVLLGLITHSPFFAKYSPGKLHLLMVGAMLADEGVSVLDLTPGDSEYKQWLATEYDEVSVLTVFFKRRDYLKQKLRRKLIESVSAILTAFKIQTGDALDATSNLRQRASQLLVPSLPLKLARRLRRRVGYSLELRIYEYDPQKVKQLPDSHLMKRDHVPDLLAFQTAESWQLSINHFLHEALMNLEGGAHVYTRAEEGRLVHYGWLIENQEKSILADVDQELYLPPKSAVLTNYYTHPAARGKGLYQKSLSQMLHDAAKIPDVRQIYISVLADNLPSRHVIEKLGFAYRFSFFKRSRFGSTTRGTNAPETFTRPAVIDSSNRQK